MHLLFVLAFSSYALSTSPTFFDQFKLARQCRHWENLSNQAKKEAKPETWYIKDLTKKMASLKCNDTAIWIRTNQNFLSFTERTESCNHFGSEEPYDKVRAEVLKKAVESLKCSELKKEEKAFKKNKDYLSVLSKLETLNELGGIP